MKTVSLIINYLLFFALSTWIVFPYLYYLLSPFYILIVFSMWCVTALLSMKAIYRPRVYILSSLSWLIMILFYHLIGLSNVHVNIYFQCFFFLFFLYAFCFYQRYGRMEMNCKLLKALFLIIMISFVWSSFTLIVYPSINDLSDKSGYNVGSTPYSFFACIIWTCSFLLYKNKPVLSVLIQVISLVLLLLMVRTISLLTAFVFIAVYFIQRISGRNMKAKKIVAVITLLILILLFFEFSDTIISIVLKVIGAEGKLYDRVNELQYFVNNGIFSNLRGSSGSARIDLYKASFTAWLSSFRTILFGNGWIQYDSYSIDYISEILVGGHSEFFDSLAKFGVFGSMLFFGTILAFFWRIQYAINEKKHIIICYHIVILFYSILNRFATEPSVGLGLFFVVPFTLLYGDELNNNKAEDTLLPYSN